jgi:hypothetical protein
MMIAEPIMPGTRMVEKLGPPWPPSNADAPILGMT